MGANPRSRSLVDVEALAATLKSSESRPFDADADRMAQDAREKNNDYEREEGTDVLEKHAGVLGTLGRVLGGGNVLSHRPEILAARKSAVKTNVRKMRIMEPLK
jgi:hypothetical protein